MNQIRTIPGGADALPHSLPGFDYGAYVEELIEYPLDIPTGRGMIRAVDFNGIGKIIHSANVAAGWWTHIETGCAKKRNVPELLCLVHSEISEALEGHRKGKQDDHLPHRPSLEVELADAMIRMFDLAGALQLDLGGAIMEKLAYNAKRADHKIENRLKADGKKL